jgi:hypothetical protein
MIDRLIDAYRLPIRLAVWLGSLAILSVLGLAAAQAQTVTLTAVPTSGVSPVAATLTWSTSGFPAGAPVACTASGGWTGAKAAQGTQTVTVSATTTYTLDCTGGTAPAVVSWTPPTTNTDGSTLTDLASYKLYNAATMGAVGNATPVTIPAPASTYTVAGLPAGTRYFGIKAVNAAGVESDMSGLASKLIAVPTATASATVTVSTKPNPPTLVTVATTAYQLRQLNGGKMDWVIVGTVPLGAECGRSVIGNYAVFDGATITKVVEGGGIVVARCREG